MVRPKDFVGTVRLSGLRARIEGAADWLVCWKLTLRTDFEGSSDGWS